MAAINRKATFVAGFKKELTGAAAGMPAPRQVRLGGGALEQGADGFHFGKADIGHAAGLEPCMQATPLQGHRRRLQFRHAEFAWCVPGHSIEQFVFRTQDLRGPPDRAPDVATEGLFERGDDFVAEAIAREAPVRV